MRILGAIVAAVVLVGCGGSSSHGGTKAAAATVTRTANGSTVTRISGGDQYSLAAELSKQHWPSASDVVIARGDDPTDALAASYIAGSHISAILLAKQHEVPQATLDELKRLGAYHIRLMGGTDALGPEVEAQLKSAGMKQVDRVAGPDRYATAAAAAANSGPANIGVRGGAGRTVLLANGTHPADALAAGPLAYGQQWPILLTAADALPASTRAAMDSLQIAHVVVLGGTAVVSDAVLDALRQSGRTVERIAGADRTATAAAMADTLVAIGEQVKRVELASATSFVTALLLGPHAAPDAPVLLCATVDDCGSATTAWVKQHAATVDTVVVAGGTNEISENAASQVAAAAA